MKAKEVIHRYFSKTELGLRIINSDFVSENDLLFLIPNNFKRRLGLKPTRVFNRRKSNSKQNRRHHILGWQYYEFIQQTINEMLEDYFNQGSFIVDLVDVKNILEGDKND